VEADRLMFTFYLVVALCQSPLHVDTRVCGTPLVVEPACHESVRVFQSQDGNDAWQAYAAAPRAKLYRLSCRPLGCYQSLISEHD
jgi:hypothetical protein